MFTPPPNTSKPPPFGHQVYLVLCQHLRKVDVIEPFQKGFDPTNLTAFFGEKRGKGRQPARTRVTAVKVKNIVGRVALELLDFLNIPIPLQSRLRPLSKKWRNYWKWLEFFQWGQHLQLLRFSPTSLKRFTKRSRCLVGWVIVELSWDDVKKKHPTSFVDSKIPEVEKSSTPSSLHIL